MSQAIGDLIDLLQQSTSETLVETTQRKHASLITIGQIGCGKSTLLCNLLQSTEQKTTSTIKCSYNELFTDSYHYTLIDAPGNRKFIKNMIVGVSQSDVALLVIPANTGEFESSITKRNCGENIWEGQTTHHSRLCYAMGVSQLIVCINKMDHPSVNYSETRLKEIKNKICKILTKIGYKTKKIPFIPISAVNGDNVSTKSKQMQWYKGYKIRERHSTVTEFTLLAALQKVVKVQERVYTKPFRMSIAHVCRMGTVITGRVEQGTIKVGSNIKLWPSQLRCTVSEIQMHHKQRDIAQCGDVIGMSLCNFNIEHNQQQQLCMNKQQKKYDSLLINGYLRQMNVSINLPLDIIGIIVCFYSNYTLCDKVGEVVVIDDNYDHNFFKFDRNSNRYCQTFTALCFVTYLPGSGSRCAPNGYTPFVCVGTARAPCELYGINWKMGKSTNNCKVENPDFVEEGDQAELVFENYYPFGDNVQKSMIIRPFEELFGNKSLGRIVCLDGHQLTIIGKVIKVNNITL